MSSIADNIKGVRERIVAAAAKCRRNPASITLVAVSKGKPSAMIREAYEAGQHVFGENYAQELAAKAAELADLDISWHFVGHLQRNKARLVAPVVSCMQTIDSIELAEALNRRAAEKISCLIEVNAGGEASKSGLAPEVCLPVAREVVKFPNLDLRGLMVIPPFDPDPERSRSYFRKLRALLEMLGSEIKPESPFRSLSMGMSHDFEVAIEEGATIVRVGTAIFGERR